MALIDIEDVDGIRILTLAHEKPTNPFGKRMAGAFVSALREADRDDTVGAIVVNGGRDRSCTASRSTSAFYATISSTGSPTSTYRSWTQASRQSRPSTATPSAWASSWP